MSDLVGQLADLTALRDRPSLDTALATTLNDLLPCQRITIARCVGPEGNERWLNSSDLLDGVEQIGDAHSWTELEDLPRFGQYPVRQQVLAQRQPVLAPTASDPHVFPLFSTNENAAVLELCCSHTLSAEQVRLVDGILRLYLNFCNLLDYGERDALTELFNRKTFDRAFMRATLSPVPAAAPAAADDRRHPARDESSRGARFWLVMLDIDHFKHVNDNFGHLIGDEVLLLLARLMRQTFRIHDQLYRFGGEEFVVLMRCPHREQAHSALERLRQATETYRFSQVGHITVSIGFTEVRHGDSPSSAIERADKAVYYAKEHGRNQVCGFEELQAQGKLASEPEKVGDIELF